MNRLSSLAAAKKLTILGINSGTSADGLDLAIIRMVTKGKTSKVAVIDGAMMPFPRAVKAEVERFIGDTKIELPDLMRSHIAFGHHLGRMASRFLIQHKITVDLIASHGQTIGHYPGREKALGFPTGATLQLGDGNAIAVETALPVVSDFRMADIASGGEGAPLTPFVNQLLFGSKTKSRIVVNIGGIANFSYHPAGGSADDIRGGDCGPGNTLSDLAMQLLYHKSYDRDGRIARTGSSREEVIALIEKANSRRGRSAGREQFDVELFARLVFANRRQRGTNADIVASIMEATALLIVQSLKPHLSDKRLEAVYLTGGGRKNKYLCRRLQESFAPCRVLPIEALGFDGDLLEAVSFAVLGGCFVMGMPSTLPRVTGARGAMVSGRLSLLPSSGKPAKPGRR